MNTSNVKSNFGDLFLEANLEAIDEVLSKCTQPYIPSKEFEQKVQNMIYGERPKVVTKKLPLRKKIAVALIAAAILLLVGCTVHAYKDRIGNLFIEVFEEYLVGQFDNGKEENLSEIKDIYTVGYVPEGYTLQKETVRDSRVTYTWQNDSGDLISFEQMIYDKTKHYIDGEEGESKNFNFENLMIYCRYTDEWAVYLWDDGEYVFAIRTNHTFSEEEIVKIIESIIEKQ